MFIMYDSVDLSQIPHNPHAVACYRDGHYRNEKEAREKFPHARILPISVGSGVPCQCYDIEAGDYSPSDVPHLFDVARSHHDGSSRPCFYANLSTMEQVRMELLDHGANREHYRLWVAYYDDRTYIPQPYDAKQFTNQALNRNLDESICHSNFFDPAR